MRKLSDIYSDTRGALFAGVAAIGLSALPAHAQDANVSGLQYTYNNSISARDAARSYAENCFEQGERCVGITLYVSNDLKTYIESNIDSQNGETYEQAETRILSAIADRYSAAFAETGTEINVFPTREPDGRTSVITFAVGDILVEDNEGQVFFNLNVTDEVLQRVNSYIDGIYAHQHYNSPPPKPEN